MKKSLITTLVVIATTLFGYFARTSIMTALGFDSAKSFSLLGITAYRLVWNVVVPALAIALIHGPRQVWSEIALSIWLTIRELQKQGRSAKIWQEKPASQPDPIGLQVVGIS